jgi:TPR repeat protein
MSRLLTAVLAVATLVMIGWYAYWALHEGRLIPGFTLFYLLFSLGLALPYLVTLVLLARRRRDGLALAFCTALLNAVWMVPLGVLALLFIGFTMGNVDQVHRTYALALAGLLQVALLVVAGVGLWYPRERTAGAAPPRASTAWSLAVLLPVLASSASWTYFAWQQKTLETRSALAARNDSAVHATMEALRECLAERSERGYPAKLEECPDIAPRTSSASGFRFEYLHALPRADGRIGASFICARPMEFRVTGHSTLVVDASGTYRSDTSLTPLDAPPTCASVLDIERAIAFCAYERAAREPAKGYPERLADIAPCVSESRARAEIGADQVTSDERRRYVYLAETPDAGGRIWRFRIYRLDLPGGSALWIDDEFRESKRRISQGGPVIEGLAAAAAPERFAPGCAQSRAADCFATGYEWDRKAHQARGPGQDLAMAPMREAAQSAFGRGCELSDARSCAWLASALARSPGADRDVVRIAALYERACALGWADGCRNAADMYQRGRKARVQTLERRPPIAAPKPDLAADPTRALALYHRGCELDNHDACFIAARLLAAGEGVEADRKRAFMLFDQLCERAWAEACSRAAGLVPGHEKDYLRRACAFGESKACEAAWK